MENSKPPSQDMSSMTTATLDQARKAMENYLQFFQKSMSATPWVESDLNKKLTEYAKQNVAHAFDFAQRLTQAKDLQEVMKIQAEFFQLQLNFLTEQAKDLGATVAKSATTAFKGPSSFS